MIEWGTIGAQKLFNPLFQINLINYSFNPDEIIYINNIIFFLTFHKDYLRMPLVEENLKKFSEAAGSQVILLMGMIVNGADVQRDLALVNGGDTALFSKILEGLNNSAEYLQLHELDVKFDWTKVYRQNNIKASRKQVLPIVKQAVDEM